MPYVTGEKFDLCNTGWSSFVQTPEVARPESLPKLVIAWAVVSHGDGRCALALFLDVMLMRSTVRKQQVLLHAGPRDGSFSFFVNLDDIVFKPFGTVRGSDLFAVPSFSVKGLIGHDRSRTFF